MGWLAKKRNGRIRRCACHFARWFYSFYRLNIAVELCQKEYHGSGEVRHIMVQKYLQEKLVHIVLHEQKTVKLKKLKSDEIY